MKGVHREVLASSKSELCNGDGLGGSLNRNSRCFFDNFLLLKDLRESISVSEFKEN